MRLFDKCLTHCPPATRDYLRQLSTRTAVLACDAIAEYWSVQCISKDGVRLIAAEDTPYCTPAWDVSFLEWTITDEVFKHGLMGGVRQFGSLIEVASDEQQIKEALAAVYVHGASLNYESGDIEVADAPANFEDASFIFYSTHFAATRSGVVRWPVVSTTFVRDDGQLLGSYNATEQYIESAIHQDGLAGVRSRKNLGLLVEYYLGVICLAFTFLNCSNVKLEDVTADLEPPPKIKRRLRIPDVKRYTLNINGHYSKPRRELGEPGEKDVMPFHLCRGHFATYTDAAPLFGKYTGRFWIPPHTKGKKENGVIEKDYAIVN